jgi:hypothetical protein
MFLQKWYAVDVLVGLVMLIEETAIVIVDRSPLPGGGKITWFFWGWWWYDML